MSVVVYGTEGREGGTDGARFTRALRLGVVVDELGKVFLPDPADGAVGVVLVAREPELAAFANDVEDLVMVESVSGTYTRN